MKNLFIFLAIFLNSIANGNIVPLNTIFSERVNTNNLYLIDLEGRKPLFEKIADTDSCIFRDSVCLTTLNGSLLTESIEKFRKKIAIKTLKVEEMERKGTHPAYYAALAGTGVLLFTFPPAGFLTFVVTERLNGTHKSDLEVLTMEARNWMRDFGLPIDISIDELSLLIKEIKEEPIFHKFPEYSIVEVAQMVLSHIGVDEAEKE